jgi:hypothetical protein
MIEIHLGGCKGIQDPKDMHGSTINVGDNLSWDYGCDYYQSDPDRIKPWMKEAIFIVKEHESGKGLCATGINKDLYLHDFRFKFCEIVELKQEQDK